MFDWEQHVLRVRRKLIDIYSVQWTSNYRSFDWNNWLSQSIRWFYQQYDILALFHMAFHGKIISKYVSFFISILLFHVSARIKLDNVGGIVEYVSYE